MGNVHDVAQMKPAVCKAGAVILVKRKFYKTVERLHNEETGRDHDNYFYTYLEKRKINIVVENVNVLDKEFQDELLFFVIQSGGKMYVGYKDFRKHIRKFSKYLEDATFYVGDDYVGFIDKYRIKDGRLYRKEVKKEDSLLELYLFPKETRLKMKEDLQ